MMNIAEQSTFDRQALKGYHHPKIIERGIAEIVIPPSIASAPIISPIVASLSQQTSDGWITWITLTRPNKASLIASGANTNRLRIVYIDRNDDARWVFWQALAQGNSHTVIAEQSSWSKRDMEKLEIAAERGQCKGVAITLY